MSKRKKRMNETLPKTTESPKIYRFITESLLRPQTFFLLKCVLAGVISGILVIAIVQQGMRLNYNLQESKKITKEREHVVEEVAYWKQIGETYKGYRDIYYRLAGLEYKLGNVDESKKYVKKALELDPNFEEGRVLGAKVGL